MELILYGLLMCLLSFSFGYYFGNRKLPSKSGVSVIKNTPRNFLS